MSNVRWGILSTASIGMNAVTPAIQRAANCDVVAIASRSGTRAREAADLLGIEKSYATYEELLNSDVDAVYIPLPNDLHAEWAANAARSGKHVLCEKPLAMNAAQAEAMAHAARESGVLLVEAFMYRHHPSWIEARRLVDSGAIGVLKSVQSWFSYFNDDPDNIRNKVENGGGALMDIGSYNVNLSRMLFGGEPEGILSSVERDPVMGIDTLTSAILEFEGGGQATFTCTIRGESDQRVHIVGNRGRIEIEIPFNIPADLETRIFYTSGGDSPTDPPTETITFDPVDQYTIQAELFAEAVLTKSDYPVPISDAIANMAVIDSILSG